MEIKLLNIDKTDYKFLYAYAYAEVLLNTHGFHEQNFYNFKRIIIKARLRQLLILVLQELHFYIYSKSDLLGDPNTVPEAHKHRKITHKIILYVRSCQTFPSAHQPPNEGDEHSYRRGQSMGSLQTIIIKYYQANDVLITICLRSIGRCKSF